LFKQQHKIQLEPVEKVQDNDESGHLNDLSERELEDLINQKLTFEVFWERVPKSTN